jgi:hypothetical protein
MALVAKHENGTTWRFAAGGNPKRGVDHIRYQQANAARNYCRKNKLYGRVQISDEIGETTFFIVVGDDCTLTIEA